MSQVEQKTVLSESKDTPAPEPRLQGEAVAQGGVAEQTMGSSDAKSTWHDLLWCDKRLDTDRSG